jgi:2,4-dienoyl-CoA reductase-like NADH-dependent reductase (Old Yellow Enzyme family)/thioredoxin reductase
MGSFKKLFQPGAIGSLSLANRIIFAPMVTHYAEEGAMTERMIAYYAERALGGAALLVLEATYPRTIGHPGRVHLWSDAFIPGLKKLTAEVHRCGGKIAIEINPSRGRVDEADPVSASHVPHPITGRIPRALTQEEIKKMEEDFGRSIIRSCEAGFDAVMIHGGTGYLISEFLSPRTNLRDDEYGRDMRGRARLAVEMVLEAKRKGGKNFPVIFRLAASERMEGGISLEDIFEACRLIGEAGADAVDVVSGVAETMEWVVPSLYFPLGCNVSLAEEIKKRVGIPVSVAGRIIDPSQAEDILNKGKTDFVVMGRALLADPYFPRKAQEGRVSEIRKCLGCLRCIESFSAHAPLVCAVNPVLGKEGEASLPKAKRKKRVLILGAGPAGMQAAITAAERGHEVILMEKERKMGGQVNLACSAPGKGDLKHILDYLSGQIEIQKDRIKVIHEKGDSTSIAHWNPNAVVAAIGSTPLIPDIPGIQEGMKSHRVVTGREVLSGNVDLGKKAVVIGGGMIGCEIADYLAEKGQEVFLVELLPDLASDAFPWIRKVLLKRLEGQGIRTFTQVREERITEGGVEIVDHSGNRVSIEADKVILATGSIPDFSLSHSLERTVPEFYAIGDCKDPRKILEAIHEGYAVGKKL